MTTSPDVTGMLAIPSGSTIEKLLNGQITFPDSVTRVVNVQSWARSLITREVYQEPDPDYLAKMLLIQTLSSATIEEAFEEGNMKRLQQAIPNVPGAGTGPIEITGFYVTGSDFGEGVPTYLILETRSLLHGTEVKYSTGASQLQAQLMVALCLNQIPLKCQITRTDRKDRGDRYMFWLIPPDTSE